MQSPVQVQIITWLGWACFAGGAVAIAVYALHFAKRQGWRRPWNAAGLFFTAIALTQIPMFLVAGAEGGGFPNAVAAVFCLLIAVAIQSIMAMRTRRRSDDRGGRASDRA